MKRNIALLLVVILMMSMTGCGNSAYKNGVKYRDFPLDDDLIYEDAIVFNFEEKRDKAILEYGSEDDVDDIAEYYQDEFESSKYTIYEEELDRDEYYVRGVLDEWEFEIEVEEASGKLEDFYDSVVTIEAEVIEEDDDDSDDKDDGEKTSGTQFNSGDSKEDAQQQAAKTDEEIFFGGIKELTLGQLESINNNVFEELFLSSIYDKINSSSYNMDFTVSTSGIDYDNESFSLYINTEIGQNYANGEGSIAFSLGETDDNTYTNNIYFSGPNTYIKKSDTEKPVCRYSSPRDGSYYADTTVQQRIYAAFASKNGSKSSGEEHTPIVERYISLLKKHIDGSVLVKSQTSLSLIENEEQCNVVNAELTGVSGYNAAFDLFNTLNYDEDAQHIFGYLIYQPGDESYVENDITSILNVLTSLTEAEKEALVFSIDVFEKDGIPIDTFFSITINEKVLNFEILEYNKGSENQRKMNYLTFDGSYSTLDETMVEIGQNQYKNTISISSKDIKLDEASDIQIETTASDSDDLLSSTTNVSFYQYDPEDGQRIVNADVDWSINKASSENYIGQGTMTMQSSSSEGTTNLDGTLEMSLDFTEEPNVIPITYIEELGVSVSSHKDLFIEIQSEEDGLQNDMLSRMMGMAGTVFMGY